MDLDNTRADAILGQGGLFERNFDGFTLRPGQQEMAREVEQTLTDSGTLLCEAGTGVGKTFAYLVPAVLSGLKVVISTGTRALQDQLFYRDLPVVIDRLGRGKKTALLKGRANYLCLHRLTLAENDSRGPDEAARLHIIRDWSTRTRHGEIAELADVAEDDSVWRRVTSTQENCLGQQCPSFNDCHVLAARRRAQGAEVLVINHHLLFSDMMLREEGFGELLPDAEAFIIDEAHQLPELASDFFGVSLSSRQLVDLGQDILLEYRKDAGDIAGFSQIIARYQHQVVALLRELGQGQRRQPLDDLLSQENIGDLFEDLHGGLADLRQALTAFAERSSGLEHCLKRSQALSHLLDTILSQDDRSQVAWLETEHRRFRLHMTPLDIAGIFQAKIQRYTQTWIFTSATLSINSDFSYFMAKTGLVDARTSCVDSPFDYAKQACLYLPESMPEPGASGYIQAFVDSVVPLLRITRGRAFLLFTSHRALKLVSEKLEHAGLEYPVLVQGSMPHAELLERFRRHGNAILLGTGSFWEGVDVRGPALSCVVIDKLPFATPDDPVFRARAAQMIRSGQNPFRDYQLPNAVISLRQGAGRLIRDCDDRGVLMICDPRIRTKSYGKIFLRNLPPMPVIRTLAGVHDWFIREPADEPASGVAGL